MTLLHTMKVDTKSSDPTFSANTNTIPIIANTIGNSYAAIAIKPLIANPQLNIQLIESSLVCNSSDQFVIEVRINPTIAGAMIYDPVGGNSLVEYAIGSSTNLVTGGVLIYSRMAAITTGLGIYQSFSLKDISLINQSSILNIVLTIVPISSNQSHYFALNWQEIVL